MCKTTTIKIKKIDFDDLVKVDKVEDLELFKSYLTEIWLDLRYRSDNPELGINRHTFFNYFILPGMISDRVFYVLDENHDGYLCISEFVNGMVKIFSGDFDKLLTFVFELYDSDSDGKITKEDVKLLLSYLPLQHETNSSSMFRYETQGLESFTFRAESQEEIKKYTNSVFEESDYILEDQFSRVVSEKCSEIFVYIVILLFDRKPFTNTSVKTSQVKNSSNIKTVKTPNVELQKRNFIVSPSLNSKFNPGSDKCLCKSPMMKSIAHSSKSDSIKKIKSADIYNKYGKNTKEQKDQKKDFLNSFSRKPAKKGTTKKSSGSSNVVIDERLEKTKHDSYTYDLDEVLKGSEVNSLIKINNNKESREKSKVSTNVNTGEIGTIISYSSPNKNKSVEEKKFVSMQNLGDILCDEFNIDDRENYDEEKLDEVSKKTKRQHLIFSSCSDLDRLHELTLVKKFEGEDQTILPAFKHKQVAKNKFDEINLIEEKSADAKEEESSSNDSSFSEDSDNDNDEVLTKGKELNIMGNNKKDISVEGYLFRISSSKKVRKYWCILVNKDIYYYKSKEDCFHKGIHNLSGAYIKRTDNVILDGKHMLSFRLSIGDNYKTTFLCEQETELNKWISSIKKVTKYEDLNDIYDIKKKLGQGKFGLVKQCIHKVTGREAAIKIIAKKEMSQKDYEQTRIEIEILKISQHPNIISLYDIFENQDYYYIIMELCKGSDLYDYLYSRNFNIEESRAKEIIRKIAKAIDYLHSYGIVHRDLKPENIMMTDTTEDADVKLLDFGLSKMIGPKDKCTERYGTLCYVSPELLMGEPYDKRIDLWSLGIISYVLLTGCLPYSDENDENEVARQILQNNVPFPNYYWKSKSPAAKNFVTKLLQKLPEKRMTISEALEHPFLKC